MKHDAEPQPGEPELEAAVEIAAKDAIGASAEPPSAADSAPETTPGTDEETGAENGPADDSETAELESGAEPQAAPKLERLQKILAQAGVASRRHAEELITQGRVQVNGQVVTTLGSKADPARDHIRVDGKLIHSAERLRYFMLNKPKGFVTTVNDPEGRPTVMQFFEKLPERLYPVGRLDYQSEGLLLVTNDGELANRLTRAASGVEKTYLVKVSGRPTEAELDILRRGVAIERGKPGSPQVNTASARIRQVRHGDNPWYEVVLIEGRNRELRKMFQEIGHFVEKIRRVGYGPLVLDVEPGKLRELDAGELAALRRAAEGKPAERRSREARRGEDRQGGPATKDFARRSKPFRESSEAGTRRGGERTGAERRGPGGPGRDRNRGFAVKPQSERRRPGGPESGGPESDRPFGAKPQWKKRAFKSQDADSRSARGGERRGDQRGGGRGNQRGGERRGARGNDGRRERGNEGRSERGNETGRFSRPDSREFSRRGAGGQRPESTGADQGEFRARPGRPGRSGPQREGPRRSGPPRESPPRGGPRRGESEGRTEGRPARDRQTSNRPGSGSRGPDSRGYRAGGSRNQSGRPFRPGARPGFKRRPESGDRERSPRRDKPRRNNPNRGR
jgi:23S rRNA pseudouridine2605 synthase